MGTYSAARDRRETLARVAALLARRSPEANAARDAETLCSVSRSLSRIAERGCNEDRTCKGCQGDGTVIVRIGQAAAGDTLGPCPKCSGTGSVDGKRQLTLEGRCATLASPYRLRCYFQGDPRGAALYLIPEESGPASEDDSHYSSRGVAAY